MRRGRKKFARKDPLIVLGENIKSPELRVITDDGENLGILKREDALKRAKEAELDLIEISPNANPPVAKITNYGKYKYELNKKAQEVRAKSHTTETKNIQIKVGTGKNDLLMKATRTDNWLSDGHRVKVEVYLKGRGKFLEKEFLQEKINNFLELIKEKYKIAEELKRSPKGMAMILEKDK